LYIEYAKKKQRLVKHILKMIRKLISKLVDRRDLTESEMEQAIEFIMEGKATPSQIASFITALRMKGETVDEICGAAKAMIKKAHTIHIKEELLLDVCGTGGDSYNTFNISTVCAFVLAAGGVRIAKHGNRSVSSKCGSADVLEALGAKIELSPELVKKCIEQIGIGFLYAPIFHPAMKYAAVPRREIGIRTIFNILGPLTNPARVNAQVLGVFSPSLTEKIAHVLRKLGVKKAMVVSGMDGMDEVSICAPSRISYLNEGKIENFEIDPQHFGIKKATVEDIKGGDASENAEIILKVLSGEKGAKRDAVLINSSLGFVVTEKARDIQEGIKIAEEIIDKGLALKKLKDFVRVTKEYASLQA